MRSGLERDRRDFLKGSLLVGTAGVAPPAAVARAAGPAARPPVAALPPTQARAQAESGPVNVSVEDGAPIIVNPGSDLMVDMLREAGVQYVAAMPGSTFRGLQESIVNYGGNRDPELITCVHEEISAALAHGYSKVAGKPMACLVHSNVGLQHASMAIYNAWCDRAPMMVLAGDGLDAATRRPWVEWLHSQTDLGVLVRDFTKWDDTPVSLQHYAESFMRAYEMSCTPPCEPVLLVVDLDLQERSVPDPKAIRIPRRAPVSPPAGEPAALAQAAAMLLEASRPVIVADRAARTPKGMALMVELAELIKAPVIDKGGRMNMPTSHFLNQSGRQGELIKQADLILGLELTDLYGLVNDMPDLPEREPHSLVAPAARVVAVSSTYGYFKGDVQDVQRYYPADLTIAADAEASLPGLIDALRRQMRPEHRAAAAAREAPLREAFGATRAKAADDAARSWDSTPISTARLSMELWERIRREDWALVSNTAFLGQWPQRLWDITDHHQFIGGEGGYGVGYGAPAAAGAALAHRSAGRLPVAIIGDGDLMVLPGSLWTLAHHRIPLLIMVQNNRAWHQETMHLQRMSCRRNRGAETAPTGTLLSDPDIDYAQVAKGMGLWAEGPVEDPDRLGAVIERGLAVVKDGRPALIDVVTQPR